jgi:enoyl-CoA hydratase/carnithine racemase
MYAWTGRMHTEYRWALLQAEQDIAVRAIIVTGAGRGFCVGADTQALQGHVARGGYDPGTPDTLAKPGYGKLPAFDANFAYHFGLGIGLVLACYADIRFAVPGVKLTTAHGKLNLPAEFGLSWLLPRMIGLARANDLLFTSRVFFTEEAHEMGLINRIVDADTLQLETRKYALQMIKSVSPASLRESKRQVYTDLHRDLAPAVLDSEALVSSMMREPDYAEGVAAFLEKRPPHWTGQ